MTQNRWIPAFAGMTIDGHGGLFKKPSRLFYYRIQTETFLFRRNNQMFD
jgi:hypothetical protein